MPKVSVIIPVYNVERYLNKCVQSIVDQTLDSLEIILVDDESPDACPQMCEEWARKDNRIKVIHKKNGGLGFARNSGLELATGEYVTFCDSDDWIEPEAYQTTYEKCKEKDLDICWFQPRRVTTDGVFLPLSPKKECYFMDEAQMRRFRKEVIGRNPEDPQSRTRGMSSCMALFRRSIFQTSGVRFPSEREVASEDLMFLVLFLPHVEKVGILPHVFYNYLINPKSISTNYSEAKHTRLLNLLAELKSFCDANYEWSEIKNHYYSQQLRIFKVILKYISYSDEPFFQKVGHLSRETRNPILASFYGDPVRNKYKKADRLYIWMMKHHVGLFFALLYKFKQ